MERKLVAILAGDVVGYSRLMNAHESETVENLQACFEFIRECVDDHGGRAFNSAGDSLLSEFGSVVDAVHCALEVQDFLAEVNADMAQDRQLLMRFGIHLGDVVVDGDNYLGDGVNIAARLEGLAEPGGICISDSVHQNVAGKIDAGFEDIGRAGAEEHRPAGPGLPSQEPTALPPPTGRQAERRPPTCRTHPRLRFCRSTTWAATRGTTISSTA